MRKTVHEWLDSHQKGMGMAKKKFAGKKNAKSAQSTPKQVVNSKKKSVRKKSKRKPR